MKNSLFISFVFIIFSSLTLLAVRENDCKLSTLGPGWECTDNCGITGHCTGDIYGNNDEPADCTAMLIPCSGDGWCAVCDPTDGGYIHIDMPPGCGYVRIILNFTIPNPVPSNDKLFHKNVQ
jgi:hypothetical protein